MQDILHTQYVKDRKVYLYSPITWTKKWNSIQLTELATSVLPIAHAVAEVLRHQVTQYEC